MIAFNSNTRNEFLNHHVPIWKLPILKASKIYLYLHHLSLSLSTYLYHLYLSILSLKGKLIHIFKFQLVRKSCALASSVPSSFIILLCDRCSHAFHHTSLLQRTTQDCKPLLWPSVAVITVKRCCQVNYFSTKKFTTCLVDKAQKLKLYFALREHIFKNAYIELNIRLSYFPLRPKRFK